MWRKAYKNILSSDNLHHVRSSDVKYLEREEKDTVEKVRANLIQMSEKDLDDLVPSNFIEAIYYPEGSPLHILTLAGKGDYKSLHNLLLLNLDAKNTMDVKGRVALHHSAKCGHVKCLKVLLDYGTDINSVDKEGSTALHIAVETEQINIISFLLDNACDASVKNSSISAPIHVAVKYNKPAALIALLSHPSKVVDPNEKGIYEATPLHYAAWDDKPECAKILLDHGAKLCLPCRIGLYPMHIAAQNSSMATLNILIDYASKLGCGSRSEMLTKLKKEKSTDCDSALIQLLCVHG